MIWQQAMGKTHESKTMTSREKIVEVMARLLFQTNPYANKALKWGDAATPRVRYIKHAKAISQAGLQIVPKEPTDNMCRVVGDMLVKIADAAEFEHKHVGDWVDADVAAKAIYKAMLEAASPPAKDEG